MSASQLALVATAYVLMYMSEDSWRPPRELGKNETTFSPAISGIWQDREGRRSSCTWTRKLHQGRIRP